MSLKSSLWRYLGLLAVAALAVGVFAGPASAKKLSAKQRAHIRAHLRKQIHKNPGVIRRKSFVKRASLVNFTLPVTIKLRGANTNSNPNRATVDLGASLGQREIDLGGSLAAEIQFHDSYDGGALGNVDLALRPSSTKQLTSTSLPLLWNTDVSNGQDGGANPLKNWDAGLATNNALAGGCNDWLSTNSNMPWDPNNLSAADPLAGSPGVPVFATTGAFANEFVPVNPGADAIDNLVASRVPGLNNLGGNPNPFPYSASSAPITAAPSVQDAVLRTAPLTLGIANEGTEVDQSTGSGPNGSQNIVIGKSGGQANLFGNIPGKSYGIDVTVSLATQIQSILRAVDVDSQHVVQTLSWPAALFNCKQAYTGSVQNYIPGVRLKGSLKISPAIMPGTGDLRIAKASLSSLSEPVPTHIALAACLSPYSVLDQAQNNSDSTPQTVPSTPGVIASSALPTNTSASRTDLSDAGTCDSSQTQLIRDANFAGLDNASSANGYSSFATSSDGSKVSVAGDITVNDIEADVIIGDR